MNITERGLQLIEDFEGLILHSYLCPAGVWTIGYGHTGPDVRQGQAITRQQADQLLRQDVAKFVADVNSLIGSAPTTQNQFDALVSFAFNVGSDIDIDTIAEGLGDSTLLRKHMVGDYDGAAREFLRWNRARGKVLDGLTRRRQAEAALYRS